MLSRVADSLYWINRYVERADNFARFLENTIHLALDNEDQDAALWQPMLEASGVSELFYQHSMPCDAPHCIEFLSRRLDNPSSIVCCLSSARENARQIRDRITTEAWEQLNEMHWLLQESSFWVQPLPEALRWIRRNCALFYGVIDATQSHDHGWEFGQLGRWMERADKTSRLIDTHWLLSGGASQRGGDSLKEEQHWIGVLSCLGAYQMFRQHVGQPIDAPSVSGFLLLDAAFPRSVRHCITAINDLLRRLMDDPGRDQQLRHLDQLLDRLQSSADTRRRIFRRQADLMGMAQSLQGLGSSHELEWMAGLMHARWSHLSISELLADGINPSIDTLQVDLNHLDDLIHQRYLVAATPLDAPATP